MLKEQGEHIQLRFYVVERIRNFSKSIVEVPDNHLRIAGVVLYFCTSRNIRIIPVVSFVLLLKTYHLKKHRRKVSYESYDFPRTSRTILDSDPVHRNFWPLRLRPRHHG